MAIHIKIREEAGVRIGRKELAWHLLAFIRFTKLSDPKSLRVDGIYKPEPEEQTNARPD